jgi:hypothetical protein
MGKLREPFVVAIDFPLTGLFIVWPLDLYCSSAAVDD